MKPKKTPQQEAKEAEQEAVLFMVTHFCQFGWDSKARVKSGYPPDADYDAGIAALQKIHIVRIL